MAEGAQAPGGDLTGLNTGPFRPGRASIVTRTRSRPAFLARAVEGVLAQSYANWEHIIVNDGGSAAALDELLAPYAPRYAGRLKVIHLPHQCGMQAAANAGLAEACGEFVAIHDDDDDWHPDFLSSTVNFLLEKGPESPYRGVVTQTVRVWEDVDGVGRIAEVSREPYQPLGEVNLFRVGYENPFPPVAFLYRRSAHAEIGLFNPAYNYAADLDFNLRFLTRWEIGVIRRPLAYYHWRRRADEAVFQNTVTAESDVHGRLLNEWLNAALRSESGGDPAKLGLAMNLARYAVGTRVGIDAVLEKNREELGRLDDLKAHLTSLSQSADRAEQALAGHGDDFKNHLSSLTDMLGGDAIARLADLKAHLTSLTGLAGKTDSSLVSIAEGVAGGGELIRQLGERLDRVAGLFASGMLPRLEELRTQMAGVSSRLNIQNARLVAVGEAAAELVKSAQKSVTRADHEALRSTVETLRGELAQWRAESNRREKYWRIGRLRIGWKSGE